jgi:hypothetical protein
MLFPELYEACNKITCLRNKSHCKHKKVCRRTCVFYPRFKSLRIEVKDGVEYPRKKSKYPQACPKCHNALLMNRRDGCFH